MRLFIYEIIILQLLSASLLLSYAKFSQSFYKKGFEDGRQSVYNEFTASSDDGTCYAKKGKC
jgi:hypothetical protein